MADTVKNKIEPYPKNEGMVDFIFGIADNSLILGQRLSELTGHGPTLETDMALTNIALDLFGEVRMFYQYAAKNSDKEVTEDDLAFFRTEREFRNALLVEQPNHDFAYTIGRQFLFDHFHYLLLKELQNSKDEQIKSIASKSLKEATYHRSFSSNWVKRLGDGTEESHERMQVALNNLWRYTEEMFQNTDADEKMTEEGIGTDLQKLKNTYYKNVEEIVKEATLKVPEVKHFQKGGKDGRHTEYMGHLLAEMQYMQRTYPGMEW